MAGEHPKEGSREGHLCVDMGGYVVVADHHPFDTGQNLTMRELLADIFGMKRDHPLPAYYGRARITVELLEAEKGSATDGTGG